MGLLARGVNVGSARLLSVTRLSSVKKKNCGSSDLIGAAAACQLGVSED